MRRPWPIRLGHSRFSAKGSSGWTIFDAAEELLAERGYAAATLKAIGERAGIPTASLYHYFGGRGQVEAELVQRYIRALRANCAEILSNPMPKTLRDSVDAAIDPLLAYFREHPSLVQLWFAYRSRF